MADSPEKIALALASGIVRQHNLLSTASLEERLATLECLLDWFNFIALPVLDPENKITPESPEFIKDALAKITLDLASHSKFPETTEPYLNYADPITLTK